MFDIIGIDWGQKTFGVAFASSSTSLVIVSQKTYPASDIWTDLEEELRTRKISKIVVGLPLNFRLEPVANTVKVQEFTDQIKNKFTGIEVFLANERGSTDSGVLSKIGKSRNKMQASENKPVVDKNNPLVHNLSAKKILEWWLEANRA